MAYFPFFMNMEELKGLIIGGGRVALRKVLHLLEYGAQLHVVTLEAHERLKELAGEGRLRLSLRGCSQEDLMEADYVIAATSDAKLNQEISSFCREKKIPVNVVDVKEECSFLFPALVKEECITVGICTGGSSPYLARYLKEKIREAMPEGVGEMAEALGLWRPLVKELSTNQREREKIFIRMAETMMDESRIEKQLTREEVLGIVKEFQE